MIKKLICFVLGHKHREFCRMKYDEYNVVHLSVCERCGDKSYDFNKKRATKWR
ncbi:hypothetical protein [Bacillus wiedmannii]|uniref:hypothetical protein n=1 Tax=Bacillus wiedmannii TaxID=1890302 RepID=UPI0015CEFD34|nr:hypothetical protein [Bacillus wiedmannii]